MAVLDPHAQLFRKALQYIDETLPESEIVLILCFQTDDGTYVSTTTEVVGSLENADMVLELAEQYATKKWHEREEFFTTHHAYRFNLVQYLPQQKQLRRQSEGRVRPRGVH